jgi:hypothetical protein
LKRWLTVVLGVGLAAAALHALLSPRPGRSVRTARDAVRAQPDIDDASRARLEQVLRRAGADQEHR